MAFGNVKGTLEFSDKRCYFVKASDAFAIILQIICGLLGNLLRILFHTLLLDERILPMFLLLELGPYALSSWAIFKMLD